MNLWVRVRRISVALVMAVLLIAPILDCTLHLAGEHSPIAAPAAGSAYAGHLHGVSAHFDHCDQHMIHCIEKSVLPSGSGTVQQLLWMVLIGSVTVAAIALVFAVARGIRGPPGGGLPVLNGQAVLTNFCISRR
ncbi:hypothetical protein HGA13_25410 [Nocardia speluncae]|uniref:Uncharacterized protein n=1 Tax=Nocardia speluncae TaxID=419477 RepID=A0A846XNY0_9NOCA|nr:hypothetical protein [Nocardia speluncae]NKY36380.1 hypothetical protein [Nocardia speluncae]